MLIKKHSGIEMGTSKVPPQPQLAPNSQPSNSKFIWTVIMLDGHGSSINQDF